MITYSHLTALPFANNDIMSVSWLEMSTDQDTYTVFISTLVLTSAVV